MGPRHQRRRNPVGADRSAEGREDPLLRHLHLPRGPHRALAVGLPGPQAGPLCHRAAQLLHPPARGRAPGAAGGGGSRPGSARVEPAGLGLALRCGAGRSRGHHQPLDVHVTAVRSLRAGEPRQARRRREARGTRRRRRAELDPAGPGLRHRPSSGDRRTDRAPHPGASRCAARRRRDDPDARCPRRDR